MLSAMSANPTCASPSSTVALRCVVCRQPFDFDAGEQAVVLRHVAYGFDFVHDGACLSAVLAWVFVEPGYDCAAFARDRERVGVVAAYADGVPSACVAVFQRQDQSLRAEHITWDAEWLQEPGAAYIAAA